MDVPSDLLGALLGGRYRIVRAIGSGGMGTVYEAVQEDLRRTVAVKVLHSHLADSPELVERFRREAQAAAALGHPHIIQVTDFANDDPPYIVMQHLTGSSLRDVLRAEGALAPARMARIALQVLSALGAAHRAHIVHRDIKPDNLFLSSTTAVVDMVTVLDFGVAKLLAAPAMTAIGSVVGTPAYMSPEQARGGTVDARADIYALAACMYHAVGGKRLFDWVKNAELILAIITVDPPPLHELRPGVDVAFSQIVQHALAKSPEHRYASAEEMAAALDAWLRGEGARALPPASHAAAGPADTVVVTGHSQPGYSQPGYSQPGYSQPGYSQPGYSQPGYSQPGYSQPGHSQPGHTPAGHPPASSSRWATPGQGNPPAPQQAPGIQPIVLVAIVLSALALIALAALIGIFLAQRAHTS